MADAQVLQSRLDQAESALHELLLGAKVVEVSYADRTVKYTRSKESDLRQYINELKRQLGQRTPRRSRTVNF